MPKEPILVIDDNAINLKLMRLLLLREGFDVKTATDAPDAFAILKTFRPRLILMDIQLPGMDGLEATRRLKADPAMKGVIILALTAYAMKSDAEKARAAGCDGFIAKPVDTRTLGSVLRRHMEAVQTVSEIQS